MLYKTCMAFRQHAVISSLTRRNFPRGIRYFAMEATKIFQRQTKRIQRNTALSRSDAADFDFLHDEIANRLVDRLLDITREFPVALELGARRGHVVKALHGHGDIETYYATDMAEEAFESSSSSIWKEATESNVQSSYQNNTNNSSTKSKITDEYEDDSDEDPSHELNVIPVVCDEELLPFPDESFDLVISNLSLHWANDVPGILKQIRRILKPDGVFLGSLLGGETLTELQRSIAAAEVERAGGISPHVSPMMHVPDAGALLQSAGFRLPTVDTDRIQVGFPHALSVMHTLQSMGENNAAIQARPGIYPDVLLSSAAIYQTLYPLNELSSDTLTSTESWEVPATFQVVYMIGWAPHENQPKPLERGSAQYSLKDIQTNSSIPQTLTESETKPSDTQ